MELTLVITIVVALGGVIVKHIYTKLYELDNRLRDATSIKEVRILIDDKINPLRDDIYEIKVKLDKMIDLYMTDHSRGNT